MYLLSHCAKCNMTNIYELLTFCDLFQELQASGITAKYKTIKISINISPGYRAVTSLSQTCENIQRMLCK